jgi:hypothetical protein
MTVATAVRSRARATSARRAEAGLLALGLLVAALYLLRGAGFVLDDWYFLRNARFDGVLHTAGSTGGDRPLGAVVYMGLFGAIGTHPAPIVLLLGMGNGIAAVLLRRILATWVRPAASTAVAALWLLLPMHTSLEAWMSTGGAVVAMVLMLGAVRLSVRRNLTPVQLWGIALLLAASTLTYEAFVLLGLPAVLAVRWERTGRLRAREAAVVSALPLAALWWAYTHRLEGRHAPGGIRNPLAVVDACFGTGIAPGALAAATLVAALGGTILVSFQARERPAGERWTPPLRLLAVGWAVVLWGVVPYLTYFYSPYGAGDRLNVLSSFGAVLVWAGLVASVPHRALALVAASALVVSGLAARVERTDQWATAGRDGWRVAQAVVRTHPDPDRAILVGPTIQRDGIAAFTDSSNVDAAVQLAAGREGIRAQLAADLGELEAADPDLWIPFDQRPWSRLDGTPER